LKTLRFETKKILITVKAYPNPSVSYRETVCCAGVDIDNFTWIRLYPVPYRDLDSDKKFKKYSIIEAKCAKASDDRRPESFRVQAESINILSYLDSHDKWKKRKEIVLKPPVTSLCRIIKGLKEMDLSLGLIKPENISFIVKKKSLSDPEERSRPYAQLGFFDKTKNVIEEIPYHFFYQFQCASENNCPGHKLSIIDWEIGQAYRDWRRNYPEEMLLLAKIKERWLSIADTAKKDVYFYVGNLHRFQEVFAVLGVFYPPKEK
jgi:hypothetical protein